jgi:hypothetical protein
MLWSEDFGRGDKQGVKETLAAVQKVRSTLEDYRIDIISFRGKIAKTPRLTKGLNQAKRRMLSVLDKRSEHLEAAVNCLFGIEGMLKKFTEQGITIEL